MIELLIALIIIGVILYIVQIIPMDGTIKRIIQVIAIAFLAIWLLQGLLGSGLALPVWHR